MEDEEIGILHFKPAYGTLVDIRSTSDNRVEVSFRSKEGFPVLIVYSFQGVLSYHIIESGLYAFKAERLTTDFVEIDDEDFRITVQVKKSWFEKVGYLPFGD